MKRVWVLQHASVETLGIIAEALESVGATPEYVPTFGGAEVPADMGDAVGLIAMGGPMGVYEENRYPFLSDEMRLMRQAVEAGKPVLGVCLGSQLLAGALGAPVTKGEQPEIGWFPVTLTDAAQADPLWSNAPSSFNGLLWHGDVFDLPKDAVSLASTELVTPQAFRYGSSAYGFLFHMEYTEEMIRGMVQTFPEELTAAGVDSAEILEGIQTHLTALNSLGRTVFERWAKLLG
jgi:GMP synthase (glutamine-hydrolysing)